MKNSRYSPRVLHCRHVLTHTDLSWYCQKQTGEMISNLRAEDVFTLLLPIITYLSCLEFTTLQQYKRTDLARYCSESLFQFSALDYPAPVASFHHPVYSVGLFSQNTGKTGGEICLQSNL